MEGRLFVEGFLFPKIWLLFAPNFKREDMSRGIYFMMLATAIFAVMNVMVKFVSHIPATEVVFFRSLVSIVLSYAMLRPYGISVWGKNKRVLFMRGLAGSIALILYFTTLQYIPLASAVTIHFLAPIFTAILGVFIVKERVKPLQWVFFAIAFSGIIMIQGFDSRVSPLYAVLGIAAAFLSGLAYNFIRKLNTTEHPMVIVFYFPLVTLPLTGAYSFVEWVQPVGYDWLLLIGVGVVTQFAQYFMTKAYQTEELSKVSSLNYIGIFYALGFGYFLFDEVFEPKVYLGMGVVLTGVVLNIWYKQKIDKKAKA